MIIACILTCVLIPAWVLPTSESGLEAGGFFLQANVQGAWGVVPIYLSEISPPAFRAIFVGLTYQLGNAISSPSTQVINALSENNFIKGPDGNPVEAYQSVMAIATAIIAIGLALTAAVGPERKGFGFQNATAATSEWNPEAGGDPDKIIGKNEGGTIGYDPESKGEDKLKGENEKETVLRTSDA